MGVVIALALSLNGRPQLSIAPDKLKHFFMSAFVQSASYSALRLTRVEHNTAMVAASAVTFSVGLGKEIYDARAGRTFDVRDLAWDIAGGAAAAALLEQSRP
ncbi:MAG: DUF2279 domain-containing protein [Gemmatimonadaceae bacterium]